MKLNLAALLVTAALPLLQLHAQDSLSVEQTWFHKCPDADRINGISSERAYKELVPYKIIQTVTVAVIDGGTDITHEDLKEVLWVNKGEIPDDGIDNDGNGYVDDINGWSFLSGPGGEIGPEQMEFVRDMNRLLAKSDLSGAENKQLKKYQKRLKKDRKSAEKSIGFMRKLNDGYRAIEAHCEGVLTKECVEAYKELEEAGFTDKLVAMATVRMLEDGMEQWQIEEEITGGFTHFNDQLEYHLNPDFSPRSMVGDDPESNDNPYYGDNRVYGPDASHGTHVAGIIGAKRNNGIGMDGVANNARIMTLRVVPNGDERDKDVANAIRYAVDNGAKVVNMSFGKDVGHMDAEVESAIQYAAEHDVLLVHAAGNDGHSVDKYKNYPNGWNEAADTRYDHWIEVGASRYGDYEKLAAPFSNYGVQVDVFAPGYEIYSTVPQSRYQSNSGTSMAAPVVAGMATLIRGMYPELSASQVKDVIVLSSVKYDEKVVMPGKKKKKVHFSKLSESGGVANLYTALALAQSIRDKANEVQD